MLFQKHETKSYEITINIRTKTPPPKKRSQFRHTILPHFYTLRLLRFTFTALSNHAGQINCLLQNYSYCEQSFAQMNTAKNRTEMDPMMTAHRAVFVLQLLKYIAISTFL
jgi:hypothetical protein